MKLIIGLFIAATLTSVVTCYRSYQDLLGTKMELPKLRIIKRNEWNASISQRILVDSHEPISLITVNYTNSKNCLRKSVCTNLVKEQQFKNKQFYDIQYHFLIDPLGNVYEGLGWYNLQPNKNTGSKQHFRSIGFVGPKIFRGKDNKLTPNQTKAVKLLFMDGMNKEIINKNYHFYGTPYLVEAMKEIKLELLQEEIDQDEDLLATWPYDNFEMTTLSSDEEEH